MKLDNPKVQPFVNLQLAVLAVINFFNSCTYIKVGNRQVVFHSEQKIERIVQHRYLIPIYIN